MAFYTETLTNEKPLGFMAALRNFGALMIRAREASLSMQGRSAQIEALEAKSDAELKAMGLTRDDITRYVFRDLYYI